MRLDLVKTDVSRGASRYASIRALLFSTLIIILGFYAQPVRAQSAQWAVTASSNAQVLLPGGVWQPLTANTKLSSGAELKVAPGGQAILTRNGDVVTLSPNSHMKLPVSRNVDGPSILQKLGTLLYKIRKREKSLLHSVSTKDSGNRPFKVDTPYLAAVIKGTVFSVNVSPEGAALHVTEGLVEAISQATGERGLVRPGQTARVSSLPGARLSVSHGGKVRGKSGSQKKGNKENKNNQDDSAKSNSSPAGKSDVRKGKGQRQASKEKKGRGLKLAVGGGAVNIAKSSKGLLRAAGASGATHARFDVPGKGNGRSQGKVKTPGQVAVVASGGVPPGLGGTPPGQGGTPPGLGGTPPGQGGTPPGQGGTPPGQGGGNNGCNGNGKKPGC